MPASARIAGHTSLTLWSLAALAVGLGLGLVAHVSGGGWSSSLASLVLTPLGVFAFIFLVTLGAGGAAAGMLAAFVVIQSGAMLVVTALLYPVSALFGRTSLLAFARAVAPAQLVAGSTRSSLAALPALIGGARDHLRRRQPSPGWSCCSARRCSS